MATPPEIVDPQGLKAAIKDWHRADGAAKRYNRNLLQDGAGIAAALGVGLGSSGVYEVAKSVSKDHASLPAWVDQIFWYALGIAALLAVLLVYTFVRRWLAEREAERQLQHIIDLDYTRYWPKFEQD